MEITRNDTILKTVYVQDYAIIPFYEGFDSTWVNKNNTRDVPSMFWTNTPATGNNSWRRVDDGTIGGWTNATAGAYSPTGSSSTTYSARFHTNSATTGTNGIMDLNINLSPIGYKVLKFWYINTSGTDSLTVSISIDGGSTFNLLQKFNIETTWTQEQIQLGTISAANSVIRFVATKVANNNTDIGA